MYDNRFSQIIKKSQLGEGGYGFLEAHRASVLARALRIFAPKTGKVTVNTFDGQEIKRMGEILRRYDTQHLAVRKLDGGRGYEIDLTILYKSLL